MADALTIMQYSFSLSLCPSAHQQPATRENCTSKRSYPLTHRPGCVCLCDASLFVSRHHTSPFDRSCQSGGEGPPPRAGERECREIFSADISLAFHSALDSDSRFCSRQLAPSFPLTPSPSAHFYGSESEKVNPMHCGREARYQQKKSAYTLSRRLLEADPRLERRASSESATCAPTHVSCQVEREGWDTLVSSHWDRGCTHTHHASALHQRRSGGHSPLDSSCSSRALGLQ